jgi:hypothetical protein
MKEIDQTKRKDDRWKSVAAVGIVAAVGLGIGYAYQTGNNDELAEALSVANSKVSLLTSREKSISVDLAEAKNRAHSTGTEWLKARDENLALTQKLKQTQEEAKLRERRLQETVGSLTVNLAASIARANTLAKALDPDIMKEIEAPKITPPSGIKTSSLDPAARNKDLLNKFSRRSDEFTRPKVYTHDHFVDKREQTTDKSEKNGLYSFLNLTVDTDGKIDLADNKFVTLQILHNDEVYRFTNLESFSYFLITSLSDVTELRCRLDWIYTRYAKDSIRSFSLPTNGDFTLRANEITALRETFELAETFKEMKGRK